MAKLFEPLVRPAAKHLYHLATRPEYRAHCRLTSQLTAPWARRRRERVIRLHGWRIRVPDVPSFLSTYQSLFVEQAYAFRSPTAEPFILDCGANIGLSVLYFRRQFPKARIIAFEPDPKIFAILTENVHGNGFTDVELVNKALWSSETTLRFLSQGADAGRIDPGAGATTDQPIDVQTTRLRPYLEQPVDLLKIDIEGAETEVIRDCADLLHNARAAFVEFHTFAGKTQALGGVIELFEKEGFRVHMHTPHPSPTPFVKVLVDPELNMDLRVNLYFYRA